MQEESHQITRLRGELEALRRQLAELQVADRDRAAFLASLGHKLRNPLAPIRNSVALLRRAGSSDPIIQRAQEIIDRQVTQLTWLADDLIAGSQLVDDPLAEAREERAPAGAEPPHPSWTGAAAFGARPPSGPLRARPRRILIVEDLLDAAITMELLLEMMGHTVEIAADGKSGLAKAASFAPEIVLCDIGLPGAMDGFEVARRIRAEPRADRVFLIALTGFGTPEDKARSEQAGFDLHLTKPIDPATLESLIAGIPVRAEAS